MEVTYTQSMGSAGTEIVENYLLAVKKKPVVIHSYLPFKDFVRLLDLLFDNGYKKVVEITEEEFREYFSNTDCPAYKIDLESYDRLMKQLDKKK